MYFPYVFFDCGAGFVINSAATSAYINAICEICEENVLGTLAADCDCDPLYWDSTGPTPVVYTTPNGDNAPWQTPHLPESNRFLGYRILSVVRPNQISRTITPRIGRSGGGVLGPLNRGAIRFDFQVLLFACDELAMEYGYRFLTNRLACLGLDSQCGRGTLLYRDTCHELSGSPSADEIDAGLWIVNDALLVNGPVWAEDPIPGMRKHVRRVDFSIAGESVEPVAA